MLKCWAQTCCGAYLWSLAPGVLLPLVELLGAPDSCLSMLALGRCLERVWRRRPASWLTPWASPAFVAFGSQAGMVGVTQSCSFRQSRGKPSTRMATDGTSQRGVKEGGRGCSEQSWAWRHCCKHSCLCWLAARGSDGSLTLQTFSSASSSRSLGCIS